MEPLQELELVLLAEEIPHTKFSRLCIALGYLRARGQSILATRLSHYVVAMQDILFDWKNEQTDPTQSRSVLASKLHEMGLGALGDKLSKGGYQPNPCDPRDKATASLQSRSVSVHHDEGLAGRKEDVSSRSNAKRLKRRRKEDVSSRSSAKRLKRRRKEDVSSRSNAKRLKRRLNTEEDNTLIFTASESPEDICEGGNCEAITDVAYHVEAYKKVCSNCASKEPRILKSKEERCIRKARKGGPKLYCEKHDKDIDSYCKTHGVACCYSCAMIDHNKLCCERLDIEDAIKENRAILRGLKEKAKNKLKSCPDYGDQIRQCRQDTEKHLLALKDEVDFIIDEAMKTDKDREQEDAAKINQEIDEKNQIQELNDEIKKNNEEREKILEQNQANSEKRRQTIENKQRSLHADIQNIAEETERKIGELEKSWQDDTKSTENAIQTLDAVLLEDDQNVVKDGHRVITSVADELDKPLDEGGVKHITRIVSGVKFVKGAGREKYNGRIDGYDWEWKLIDTINVTDKITCPAIVGCIDEYNVIITDGLDVSSHTYMLDMNTKHTQRVITGSVTSWVESCALLHDEKVVCGKVRIGCTGDSLTGCISVYDRQWKLINDVTIPRDMTYDDTGVDVAADKDGMIIAAERGQSKIYVINPADGKIMNTITCKQKIVAMCGVLSSGHIVAKGIDGEDLVVAFIDREDAQREITCSDAIFNVCVDPMTDDLYVVTSDDESETCVIDQVMSGGDMKKRRVASFPLSTRLPGPEIHLFTSRVIMTSSGNMIASDGANILIFKKMFSL